MDQYLQNNPSRRNRNSLLETLQFDGLRIRMVEYPTGYRADHWCQKGHIVHCIKGELASELQDGQLFSIKAGESYVVSDNRGSHWLTSKTGVKLMIIDGDFLKLK